MNFLGIDIGASSTRAISQSGRIGVIPNNAVILGEDEEVRFNPYDDELESALYMKITKSGVSKIFPKRVLYGSMAERHSHVNIRPSVQQAKHMQELSYISVIAAAATSRILFEIPENLKLYIAVPPVEVQKAEEAFREELVGQFVVEFPKYRGGTTVKINVEGIKCKEESVMALASFFFSLDGTIRENSKQFLTGNVLSANIGASTTDLSIAKNGRYLETSGRTIPVGGNIARDYLIDQINIEYGFELPLADAEKVMAEGRMSLGNSYVDVSKIVSDAKDLLARDIVARMDPYFKSIGIPIQTLKGIAVSGGGSLRSGYIENNKKVSTSEPMSEFVTRRLKQLCDTISVVSYGDEARLADLKGLYIYAQMDASKEAAKGEENFKI